jgi:hypothetical protein
MNKDQLRFLAYNAEGERLWPVGNCHICNAQKGHRQKLSVEQDASRTADYKYPYFLNALVNT